MLRGEHPGVEMNGGASALGFNVLIHSPTLFFLRVLDFAMLWPMARQNKTIMVTEIQRTYDGSFEYKLELYLVQ
jgi:hypothetical protein